MVSPKRSGVPKHSVVRAKSSARAPRYVLQFRIELLGVEPPAWRRIQVPESYSFWGLHVAIQDAMGWLDCHLHAFRVVGSALVLGIPVEDADDIFETQPGWEHKVKDFFDETRCLASYEYDFGDSWIHEVRFEGFEMAEEGVTYPRCPAGARKCPPEDCGGVHGYGEFLKTISDPGHPEHEETLEWCGGSFDPEEFEPGKVRFDNPRKRWRMAFEETQG